MASIEFGSKTNLRPYGELIVNVVKQSIADNTTTISYSLILHRPSAISSSASKSWSCTINGKKYSGSGSIGGSKDKTLLSGTQVIPHNSDGTKTISFSASIELAISWGGSSLGTISGSGSLKLTTIARKSSFGTITGNVIGSEITVNINRNAEFTHTIQYKVGSGSFTNIKTGATTKAVFTLPMSLCNSFPNDTSGNITLRLITYNGSTNLGYVDKTLKVSVPASVKPSVSDIVLSEAVSGIDTQFGGYVQGKSKLSIKVVDSGSYGSTIKSRRTTLQGVSYTQKEFTSGLLNTSGEVEIKTTVTDSRGRTATRTETINVLVYEKPKAVMFKVERCLSDGTLDDEGEYAKIRVQFEISSINNLNSKSVKIQRYINNAWETLQTFTDVYMGIKEFVTTQTFDTETTFQLRMVIDDYFYSVPLSGVLNSAWCLISYMEDMDGLAFGKVAELSGYLDIALQTLFRKEPEYYIDGRRIVPLKIISGNNSGDGVMIGSNGIVIIASGESGNVIKDNATIESGATETTLLGSDNEIKIYTNLQNGWDSRKEITFDKQGNVIANNTADSGWKNATLTSDFALYGTNDKCRYRKIGNIVTIEGVIKPSKTLVFTGTTEKYTIFNLPSGYRPSTRLTTKCEGSGGNNWLLSIATNGDVLMERHRTREGVWADSTTSNWLPFAFTFFVD